MLRYACYHGSGKIFLIKTALKKNQETLKVLGKMHGNEFNTLSSAVIVAFISQPTPYT